MYNPELKLINEILSWFGLGGVAWLQDPNTAMLSVVITTVWWTIGFNFLLYLAALQNIPEHLYEAASLDGAGSWRKFASITLPQLRSEEHTSELQSRGHLVCRLLLEK